MRHVIARPLGFLLLAAVAGCGGCNSATTPSVTNFAGSYSGTAQDNVGGSGIFSATLAQSGSTVSGTWRISFPAGDNAGSLSGTVSGSSLSARLTPSNPAVCSYNLTANLSGNRLSGTYAAFNCAFPISGSISATKQ